MDTAGFDDEDSGDSRQTHKQKWRQQQRPLVVGLVGSMAVLAIPLIPFSSLLWMLFLGAFVCAVAWHDRFSSCKSFLPGTFIVKEKDKQAHNNDNTNGTHAKYTVKRGTGVTISSMSPSQTASKEYVACTDCGEEDCTRSRPRVKRCQTHPWEFTAIPSIVDDDVSFFAHSLLNTFVNSWFQPITDDNEFQQSVKLALRKLISVVYLRFKQVDLKDLILNEVLDVLRDHLQSCVVAHSIVLNPTSSKTAIGTFFATATKRTATNSFKKGNSNTPTVPLNHEGSLKSHFGIQRRLKKEEMKEVEKMVVLDSNDAHPATRSSKGIQSYCRSLAYKLTPFVCDEKMAQSDVFHHLLSDLLGGFVFETLFRLMADPSFIHGRVVAIFADVENPSKFFRKSNSLVQLLTRYCNSENTPTALSFVGAQPRADDEDTNVMSTKAGEKQNHHNSNQGMNEIQAENVNGVAKGEDNHDGDDGDGNKKEHVTAGSNRVSALTTRLPDVLNDKGPLNSKFQSFLNENNAIEALIFVYNVDTLQNHVIQCRVKQSMCEHEGNSLSLKEKQEALKTIHDLADTAYLSLGDLHRSDNGFLVDSSVMASIRQEIVCVRNVGDFEKFESVTDPLVNTFKTAYDTVYHMLDTELFPDFLHSSHYFNAILHRHASSLPKKKKRHVRNASIGSTASSSNSKSRQTSSLSSSSQPKRDRAVTLLETSRGDKEGGSLGGTRSRTTSFRVNERTGTLSPQSISYTASDVEDERERMRVKVSEGDDISEESAPGDLEDKRIFSLEGITVRMKMPSVKGKLGLKYYAYNMDVICKQSGSSSSEEGKASIHPVLGRNWTVSRRYREFAKLDKILRSFFPDKMPLPEKKMLNNMKRRHIQERRKALSNYIEALLSNHLLQLDQRCCVAIYYFLENSSMFSKIARGSLKIHNILRMGKQAKGEIVDMDLFLAKFIVTNHDVDETKEELLLNQTLLREQELLSEEEEVPPTPIINVDDRAVGITVDVPAHIHSRVSDLQPVCVYKDPVTKIIAMVRTLLTTSRNRVASDMLFSVVDDVLHATVDDALTRFLDFQLHNLLCEGSMSEYICTLCEVLFDENYNDDVSEEEATKMKEEAETLIKELLPDAVKVIFGKEMCDSLLLSVLDYFSSPVLNAQLTARVIDVLFHTMFPELNE
eukprot:m.164284 g.164284  ORF g.164284 m.164284 type:complete len:1167 (+) comp13423_c0_seq9:140-3640(+)